MPDQDQEQLKLLATFHYVLGGLLLLFSLIALPFLALGIALIFYSESIATEGDLPPVVAGWILLTFAIVILVFSLLLPIGLILSGYYLKRQKRYWFSFVVACVECLNMPLGTALGIFTLVVLSRDSVKQLYGLARL
ncbi:MAG: hypothetical protein HC921_16090 [Synechococcaceae cyanobacterium SM2_3_1]|nr:hypothetical protein [Synechococcaceae cyanobacterium SM2_3_1]